MEELKLTNKKIYNLLTYQQACEKKLTLITLFMESYRFLILDEPFNSIDMQYVYELKQQLKILAKSTTILISSHILDTLNDLCDEFIYLENGAVVKQFSNIGENELERVLFQGMQQKDGTCEESGKSV